MTTFRAIRFTDKAGRYFKDIHIDGQCVATLPTTHFTPLVRDALISAFMQGRRSVIDDLFAGLPQRTYEWEEDNG